MNELGVTKDQVYNADETALMWKMLPTRSYVLENQKSMAGYKNQKERLTFLLGGKRFSIMGQSNNMIFVLILCFRYSFTFDSK